MYLFIFFLSFWKPLSVLHLLASPAFSELQQGQSGSRHQVWYEQSCSYRGMFLEDAVAKVSETGWVSLSKYRKELAGYNDCPSLAVFV